MFFLYIFVLSIFFLLSSLPLTHNSKFNNILDLLFALPLPPHNYRTIEWLKLFMRFSLLIIKVLVWLFFPYIILVVILPTPSESVYSFIHLKMLYRYLNGMRMFFFGKYDILTQSHTGFKSGIIPFPVSKYYVYTIFLI